MLRSSLFTASAFALAATAGAQSTPRPDTAEKITGPVKNAGIYHVDSGTWTRTPGAIVNLGPATVYTNTADSGYFSTGGGQGSTTFVGDSAAVDAGGLPGPGNANHPGLTNDCYAINGFQLGYCDFSTLANQAGWDLSFYDDYASCQDPSAFTSRADLVLTGFPSNGCWIVTIDLEGGGEFALDADGGAAAPGFDDDPDLDSFGFLWNYSGTGLDGTGLIIKGDPRGTDPGYLYVPPGPPPGTGGTIATAGTETYYGGPSNCGTGISTGYLQQDQYRVDDFNDPMNSGCYYFLGYANISGAGVCGVSRPFTGFHLELYSDLAFDCGSIGPNCFGTNYCSSNANSTGSEALLEVCGSDSAGADNVQLNASSLPNFSFGFFITSQTQGFVATPPGSVGNLCLGGNIGRFVASNQIKSSGATGEFSLDTTAGEWTLSAIPTATGPYMAMPGITTNFQAWYRDSVGGTAVSNFTNGSSVTWAP
ncbi:MAG: hypothetical protein AAF726_17625 [Planctomycetota bacterium]